MALGFNGGRSVDNDTPITNSEYAPKSENEKDGAAFDGYDGDVEKGRKMSRVLVPGEDGDQYHVGKQMELEATNSIKYRTCSWKKVI